MARVLPRLMVVMTTLAAAGCQPSESASCQSNIVSSTGVATFCGHRKGNGEVFDLLILWRGKPGWFHGGQSGVEGTRVFGARTKGVVSARQTYGDVTIAFDADFDAQTVTIGRSTVKLDRINTVIVDDVDGSPHVSATRWTEPHLPLGGDWNLALAHQSGDLLRDLRCDVPMPAAPASFAGTQVPVITVCEKLKE